METFISWGPIISAALSVALLLAWALAVRHTAAKVVLFSAAAVITARYAYVAYELLQIRTHRKGKR